MNARRPECSSYGKTSYGKTKDIENPFNNNDAGWDLTMALRTIPMDTIGGSVRNGQKLS